MSYTHMLIRRPCQNVRECPKEAVTISLYASHTTHVWTCEGDSGSSWSYWCLCTILEAQLLACTLLPLYIYRVEMEWSSSRCFCTCNNTVLIIPCRCGIDLDLFCTRGHSFVYTSELPLSSRDMWYIIQRKIRSMGFSEAVDFPQGTHTNTDGLGIKDWGSKTGDQRLGIKDWGSKTVRNRPSSDLTLDRATYAIASLNTSSDRSTMAQSNDRPWHLWMVIA